MNLVTKHASVNVMTPPSSGSELPKDGSQFATVDSPRLFVPCSPVRATTSLASSYNGVRTAKLETLSLSAKALDGSTPRPLSMSLLSQGWQSPPQELRLCSINSPSFVRLPATPVSDASEEAQDRERLRVLLKTGLLTKLRERLPSRPSAKPVLSRSFKDVLRKKISKWGLVRKLGSYWLKQNPNCPVIFKRIGVDTHSDANAQVEVQDLIRSRPGGPDSLHDIDSDDSE